MSIKVSIPFQDNINIEIDGDMGEVKKVISELDGLFEVLKGAVGELKPLTTTVSPEPVSITRSVHPAGIPTIAAEVKTNLRASLIELISSDWGKQSPKTMKEIIEALRTNGIYRGKSSISSALFQLSQTNKIRRYRENQKGEWKYTAV